MMSLHYLLGVVAAEDVELEQIDMKIAFLHEDINMFQLVGFTATRREQLICRMKKSLYSLKQASRM